MSEPKPPEMSDVEAWNKHIDAGFPFRMYTSREEQQMKDCFLAGITHERSRAAVGLSEIDRENIKLIRDQAPGVATSMLLDIISRLTKEQTR